MEQWMTLGEIFKMFNEGQMTLNNSGTLQMYMRTCIIIAVFVIKLDYMNVPL